MNYNAVIIVILLVLLTIYFVIYIRPKYIIKNEYEISNLSKSWKTFSNTNNPLVLPMETYYNVANIEECIQLAYENDKCQSFVYDSTSKKCMLKPRVTPYRFGNAEDNIIFGIKKNMLNLLPRPEASWRKIGKADTNAETLITTEANTEELCKKLCDDNNSCQSYTYDSISKKCCLKKNVGDIRITNEENKSVGIKDRGNVLMSDLNVYTNMPYLKYDNTSNWKVDPYISHYGSGLDECKDKCDQDGKCKSFDYDMDQKRCMLKDKVAPYKIGNREGHVFGIKNIGEIPLPEKNYRFKRMNRTNNKVLPYDRYYNIDNIDNCESICNGDEKCKSYSYNSSLKSCQLKSSVIPYTIGDKSDAHTFGIKMENDMDFPLPEASQDINWNFRFHSKTCDEEVPYSSLSDVSNINSCINACNKDAKCQSISYNQFKKSCDLRSRVGKYRPNSCQDTYAIKLDGTMIPNPNYEYKIFNNTNIDVQPYLSGIGNMGKCQEMCDKDPKCKGYIINGDKCGLLSHTGNYSIGTGTGTLAIKDTGEYISPSSTTPQELARMYQNKVSTLPPITAQSPTGFFNVYLGTDNMDVQYYKEISGTLEECERKCFEDNKCMSYTFDPITKICRMKATIGTFEKGNSENKGKLLGIKINIPRVSAEIEGVARGLKFNVYGATYPRDLPYGDEYSSVQTLDACQQICDSKDYCSSFLYNTSGKNCKLYGGTSPQKVGNNSPDYMYGVRADMDVEDRGFNDVRY
jgi:hypothetical protein